MIDAHQPKLAQVGERLVVVADDRVIGLRVADGAVDWERPMDSPRAMLALPDGGLLVAYSVRGEDDEETPRLALLDGRTGAARWSKSFAGLPLDDRGWGWSTPHRLVAIGPDRVLCVCHGYPPRLATVNPRTGALTAVPVAGGALGNDGIEGFLATPGGVAVTPERGGLVVLSPDTGQVVWRQSEPGGRSYRLDSAAATAVGPDGLWVAMDRVVELRDPGTGAIRRRVRLAYPATALASDAAGVYAVMVTGQVCHLRP